jgi:transcriptional regulator with XRE-family HTH domain
MNLVSLKKIAEDKAQTEIGIKKVTDYLLDPRNIEIEPGFNGRDMENLSPRTRSHIDRMKEAIRAGVIMPPLRVRVADKIYVVEGHCRLTAYKELIAEGEEIALVKCEQFNGNDEDRDFEVLNSSSQLHLTRLEQGRIYKRRAAYGWSVARIAERARMSPSYVEQNLMLANANADVQALLEADKISAKVALDALRKHGEQAGAVLAAKLAGAKGGKLTGSSVSKAPPPKVVRRMTDAVGAFFSPDSPVDYAMCIRESLDDELLYVPVGLMRALLEAHEAAALKEAA